MKKLSAFISTITLSLVVLVNLGLLMPGTSMAAEEQKVGVKVGKPLQEAIAAGQKKQWDDALAKLNEAKAVPDKTAFEEFKINEIMGFVLYNQKKFAEAAAVFEKSLDSGFLSAEETDQRLKTLIQLELQAKQYNKALEHLPRWLKSHPNDTDMIATLGQLQLMTGQTKPARDTFEGLISAAEKAGQKPKEEWLKIVYSIDYKMLENPAKLDKPTLAIVEKLLRYYPAPIYWEALLNGLQHQQSSDGVKFQLYRLMLAVGALKSPDDYVELAQLANSFGLPGEAVSVLNAGFAAKILGVGDNKESEQRKLAYIKKFADADFAALPSLDKKARESTNGQDDATLGEAYIGFGQYTQAIEAIERGLKKGDLKKPELAEIALGIAYANNKQKDQARAAFKQVPADSDLARIASLWILHLSN